MMNHLTSMKIAWNNVVSAHTSVFMDKDFWMGYKTILLKDDGVLIVLMCSKWG